MNYSREAISMPCSRMTSWQQQREQWLVPSIVGVIMGVREKIREVNRIESPSKNRAMVSRFTLQDTGGGGDNAGYQP